MAGYRRDGSFFWMLRSDSRAMGRVLDVVWYDFRLMTVIRQARTRAMGSVLDVVW